MSRRDGREVVVLATHARSVAAPERERFAAALRETIGGHGLLLETCHRVEGYAVVAAGSERPAQELDRPSGIRELRGEAAIRHAISVAVGRDSVVVGEDQVLHQLRTAVDQARATGALDPLLERLFSTALRSGRRARSWKVGPSRSLATVAIEAIERRTGPLSGRRVLIVGAGRMGHLAARAATAAGASVSVGNRSVDAADALASQIGADLVPFDPGPRARDLSAVIVALAGRWSIAASTAELLDGATVVDLSLPAAVEPSVAGRLGSRLITADDLARIEPEAGVLESGETRRLDALIDQAAAEVLAWLEAHEQRAAAAALAQRADAARETELEALWLRLPDLDADTRAAIEAMTRHFSARLLREPLERLGHDPDGTTAQAVREVFAL